MKKWLTELKLFLRGLPEKNKLLLLSLVVGISSGLAAVLLETLVRAIHRGLTSWFDSAGDNFLYLVYPGVGMLLSLLILRLVIKDNIGHGVTKVLVAVSKNESRIRPHNMWSSILTSSLTIGFGGSVGAEAPIVYTGAAIGSNFARYMGMSYRNITILLGCGAAGAVAGIFKAPLAGVLFTLEILLFNISMTSMMPLLLSTVSATMVSYIFLGDSLPFECTLTPFEIHNVPFYVLLGFFCGLCSLYFLRTTLKLEDRLGKMKNPYVKWAFCAIGLGLLIFLFPPLYGEGYDALGPLLNGQPISYDGETVLSFMLHKPWLVPVFFALILFLKVFSMTLTNAGGGVGGTFGPTLFVGAIAGFLLARVTNLLLAGSEFTVPEQNFVLVGMAGLKISDVVETNFTPVSIDATLGEFVQVISSSARNIFPVVDSRGHLQGYVSLEDVRKDMFQTDLYDKMHVYNYMKSSPAYVYEGEKMDSVMKKFENTDAWNLPVVKKDRTYVGFVSKSKIFSAYREELKELSQD